MLTNRPTDWANVVRERRRELGLSQAELADGVGVSRQWVSNFENGRGTAAASLGRLLDLTATLELNAFLEPEES